MAQMGQGNAHRVIEFGRAGERWIKALAVEIAHQLETDFARDVPVEFPAGEFSPGLAADVDGKGRCRGVEELLGMIIREQDP
jgi:hypothetical protein